MPRQPGFFLHNKTITSLCSTLSIENQYLVRLGVKHIHFLERGIKQII